MTASYTVLVSSGSGDDSEHQNISLSCNKSGVVSNLKPETPYNVSTMHYEQICKLSNFNTTDDKRGRYIVCFCRY